MDIHITARRQHVMTTDGLSMRVRFVTVRHSGYYGELNTAPSYSDVAEVRIFLQRFLWNEQIVLPKGLQTALRAYFTRHYGR